MQPADATGTGRKRAAGDIRQEVLRAPELMTGLVNDRVERLSTSAKTALEAIRG